jgi:hypothetical protein
MMRNDFTPELRRQFGGAFDELPTDYKDVLNTIYHFNEYGSGQLAKDVNAAQVGDALYFRKHRKITDVKPYNDYKRKVRTIISNLTQRGFLVKGPGARPHYVINKTFERSDSSFD